MVALVIDQSSTLIVARTPEGEPRQVPRRLPPAENALPRGAQVRRRRQFNPAHGLEAGAAHDDADDGLVHHAEGHSQPEVSV